MDLKIIFYQDTYSHKNKDVLALSQSRVVINFNVLTVLICLAFLIQPVYSSGEMSESIRLDNSGNPLSIVNVRRTSLNFWKYLSPPSIAGSQMIPIAIASLYYLYNATYIINLNSIICISFFPWFWTWISLIKSSS